MKHFISRSALLAATAALALTTPLSAQAPTRAGTEIVNIATASYTDANGNSYTDVTAQAKVTVSFVGSLAITAPADGITVGSPSTGNDAVFRITNTGNGDDYVIVAASGSGGAAVTGYRFGGTDYATPVLLNAAIQVYAAASADSIAMAGGFIDVTVVFSVTSNNSGSPVVGLTATSVRSGATSASGGSTYQAQISYRIAVTPDAATLDTLTNGGTGKVYTQTFRLTNSGNRDTVYAFKVVPSGVAGVTIDQVNATAGDSIDVAVNGTVTGTNFQDVVVQYTVPASVAAGTVVTLTGTARHKTDATDLDLGTLLLTVRKASLAMLKRAYATSTPVLLTDTITTITRDQTFWYRISVTNTGNAGAELVQINDPLPAELTFQAIQYDVAADWNVVTPLPAVNATGTIDVRTKPGVRLANGDSKYVWVQVKLK